MSIELLSTVVATSAIKLVAQAISDYRERRAGTAVARTGQAEAVDVEVEVVDFPPELLAKVQERLGEVPSDFKESVRVSRAATGRPEKIETHALDSAIGGAALAISPAMVFSDARKRIGLVFKLNLILAISLAVILLGGLAGVVISGLLFKSGAWAATFGGISAADLLGLYIFKPFTAINSALVATQRLDAIHLRVNEQLKVCEQYTNLSQRIKCQTKVWETMQAELAVLAG